MMGNVDMGRDHLIEETDILVENKKGEWASAELEKLFTGETWIFPIPESARERLKHVTVESLSRKDFDEFKMVRSGGRVKKESDNREEWDGATIVSGDGSIRILICEQISVDREDVLAHEGLHAAGTHWAQHNGEYVDLEDSVIEVLRVANKVGKIEPREVFEEMKNNNIKVAYLELVEKMLLSMYASSEGGKPVNVVRLAELFFDEMLESPASVVMEIVRNCRNSENKQTVLNLLSSLVMAER